MRLSDEQIDRYRAAHFAWVRAVRNAELQKRLLEAEELTIHLDTAPGLRFDVWGDGELKSASECSTPPT